MSPAPARNLIILCTDEMRGDCLAANRLNPDIRTPHMDALAARGVNLSRHFTTFPKCVPSRVSLVTGRYCHTDGYRNIFQHLPAGNPDLLSALKAHQYQSALIGKNHCWEHLLEASHQPPELKPGQQGMPVDHHSWTSALRHHYDAIRSGNPPPRRDPHGLTALGIPPDLLEHGYDYIGSGRAPADDAYTNQAIDFLTRVRDRSRPFFMQVNIEKPHPKYMVEEPYFSMYPRDRISPFPYDLPAGATLPYVRQREVRTGHSVPEAALREIQATYYGMVSKVDHLMGQILAALTDQGLWDDTVVLLWSDHGDFAGQYGLPEKWDTCFCDALMHVPCVLAAPTLPHGQTLTALTDNTDLAPTLLELLGLPPLPGTHGSSLLPVLSGQSPGRSAVFADGGHEVEMRRRMALTTAQPHENRKQTTYRLHPDTMARARMVRTHTHKLVIRESGGHELFDLKSDRWEMHNLFGSPGTESVTTDLLLKLAEWSLVTDPDRPFQSQVGA